MPDEEFGFIVLDDASYNKGKFLLQGAVTTILEPLRMYGQGEYVQQAILEIVKLAEDWGLYVRGVDKPISANYVRRAELKKGG